MKNYYEIFRENLENELNEFKASYQNPIVAYNDWYIIGFYEAYNELFGSGYCEYEDYEEIYKWLSTFKNPLRFLYDEWLGADGAFNHDWDMMWDFVETIYKEER